MQDRFLTLYNAIIQSGDPQKMQLLGSVVKAQMKWFIDNKPAIAQECIDALEAVNWHNYLTPREADDTVQRMKPTPAWSRQQWETQMQQAALPTEEPPCYNAHALYATMSMIGSDSGQTLRQLLGTDDPARLFQAVYRLALDRLKDRDGVFNVRTYFGL